MTLDQVYSALSTPTASKLPSDTEQRFRKVVEFRDDIDHLISILQAREQARKWMSVLEQGVNDRDRVPFGPPPSMVDFRHARFLVTQSYITSTWSLADRITGAAGQVLCSPAKGLDRSKPVQLVEEMINKKGQQKVTVFALLQSVRDTFGWPIAISYAIRNHFVHDGAQWETADFFEGTTAESAFKISSEGWRRVKSRAEEYGVTDIHQRDSSTWPTSPQDDLRAVFDVCEREMDDALGVLIGSACGFLRLHAAFMLGLD